MIQMSGCATSCRSIAFITWSDGKIFECFQTGDVSNKTQSVNKRMEKVGRIIEGRIIEVSVQFGGITKFPVAWGIPNDTEICRRMADFVSTQLPIVCDIKELDVLNETLQRQAMRDSGLKIKSKVMGYAVQLGLDAGFYNANLPAKPLGLGIDALRLSPYIEKLSKGKSLAIEETLLFAEQMAVIPMAPFSKPEDIKAATTTVNNLCNVARVKMSLLSRDDKNSDLIKRFEVRIKELEIKATSKK
jgi:hypothetical protein